VIMVTIMMMMMKVVCCVAVETISPGRPATNLVAEQSSVRPVDETQLVELNDQQDDETGFSLQVDSRYQVDFRRLNSSRVISSAKELLDDTELDDGLPGRFLIPDGQSRRGGVGRNRRLSSGDRRRRIAYPGAPVSQASGGRDGWTTVDALPSSYVVGLRRFSRLYETHGGRLVPAVWPRRAYSGTGLAHQSPREDELDPGEQQTTAPTTRTSSTPGHGNTHDNRPATSALLSTTVPTTLATTKAIETTTTIKTTTTTTTKASTTTDEEEQQEKQAAAVHDTRQQQATATNDKQVSLLDVGAPEIGELIVQSRLFFLSRRIIFILHTLELRQSSGQLITTRVCSAADRPARHRGSARASSHHMVIKSFLLLGLYIAAEYRSRRWV